ncbi:Down syndrome cell adhesion molecule-like protein Dscam2 [Halotydeus destructor]|nr:Down syndrome cell adhesion molecule-like protein Dscam2 [Halotydeus destructor]
MITWTLDGLPLETRKADLYSLRRALWGDYVMFDEGQVVSHVNLTANSVFDGGLFSCTASNSVGSVTHSAMLRVLGQTQVRPMHNKMATAGQSIVLNCHTVGDEPVAIEWYKVPPVIESFKFDSKLQQGMRTRVYCNMAQGDVPVKLSWAKDGCPLSDHVHYNMAGLHVRQIDEFSLALVIENLSTHHNGNYSCLAENEAASVNHTSELLVNVPPSWLVEPKSLLVVEGTPATIDCMAQGFPTPQVTWKRLVHTNEADKKSSQYQLIRSGPHYQVYENGTLRISKSLLADRGNYLCQG